MYIRVCVPHEKGGHGMFIEIYAVDEENGFEETKTGSIEVSEMFDDDPEVDDHDVVC